MIISINKHEEVYFQDALNLVESSSRFNIIDLEVWQLERIVDRGLKEIYLDELAERPTA